MVGLEVEFLDECLGQRLWGFEEPEIVGPFIASCQQGIVEPILWILVKQMAFGFAVPFSAQGFEHVVGVGIELAGELPRQADEIAFNGDGAEYTQDWLWNGR